MTAIDDAPERDRAIVDVDWHVFPPGTERDVFAAPSGGLYLGQGRNVPESLSPISATHVVDESLHQAK